MNEIMDCKSAKNRNVTFKFSLNPHTSRFVLKQSSVFPMIHNCYEVCNYGQTQVVCELWYGTELGLIGIVSGAVVKPGETDVIHDNGNLYYVTVLKVTNDTDSVAYFTANYTAKVDELTEPEKYLKLHMDMKDIFKELFSKAIKVIPEILDGIEILITIVELFWPKKQESVWDQIKDKVAKLIDEATLKMVEGILSAELTACKERIIQVMEDVKTKQGSAGTHYMNIAEDFIGFEHKFIIGNNTQDYRKTNFFLLPLYSTFIHMKLCFYLTGITQQEKIGLTDDQVEKIKRYGVNTIQSSNGAIQYIQDTYKERVENAYNTSNPYEVYNTIMGVRSLISVFGLEYIPIWTKMMNEPFSKNYPYNDVISYSTFYGTVNTSLNDQATATELIEPLTPELINGIRNNISSIEVFIWRFDGVPKVSGVRICFVNNKSYLMGTKSGEAKNLEFNGAFLLKFSVFGTETIDCMDFFLSDGREITVGTKGSQKSETFYLKDHHIASLFLSRDSGDVTGRIVNIAVSYQLTEAKTPVGIALNNGHPCELNVESRSSIIYSPCKYPVTEMNGETMDSGNIKNVSDNFVLTPHSSLFVLKQSTGFPMTHYCYAVDNYGRTEIVCELWYGTELGLIGIVSGAVVKPGEKDVILHDNGNWYYVTVLKVTNNTDTVGYFTAYYAKGKEEPEKNLDIVMKKVPKTLFSKAIKTVPDVLEGIQFIFTIVEMFWPRKQDSVWDQIKEEVGRLVDEATLNMVEGLLSTDLTSYKEKITQLMGDVNSKNSSVGTRYMNIAQDFIGFEQKFIVGSDTREYRKTNFLLLPLYSTFIHLKLCFYLTGITQQEKLSLTYDQVEKIKMYGMKTIQGSDGAIKYIRDMYQERVTNAYNTSNPNEVYNTIMGVRSLISVFGLEYIPIWTKMMNEPFSKNCPYNDVISYSTFFGRQSTSLNEQAVATELVAPLTPELINGIRNNISSIEVFLWRFDGVPKVSGVKICFVNNRNYIMGTESGEVEKLEFNGAFLIKLVVSGTDTIDSMVFFFSDAREITVGTKGSEKSENFYLKDHHIASLFLSRDNGDVTGRIANIAVSYQLMQAKTSDTVALNIGQGYNTKVENIIYSFIKKSHKKYLVGDNTGFTCLSDTKLYRFLLFFVLLGVSYALFIIFVY